MQTPYISLGSEQLSSALLSTVEVRQALNDHWTCRVVLRDTPDRRPPVEDYAGKELKISTTDLDGTETVIFQGFVRNMRLIYEISGSWGAELEAVSATWKMAQGTRLKYFRQQTAQAAAQSVVSAAGLSQSGTMPAGAHLSYVQWDETDYSFFSRLVDDTEAWFRPEVSGGSGVEVQTAFQSGTTVNWREGEYGLLEWVTQGSLQPITASGANYDPQTMMSTVAGGTSSSMTWYGNAAEQMVSAAQDASGAMSSTWVDRHRAATLADLTARMQREARRGLANIVRCSGISRNPKVRAGDTLQVTGLPGVDATYGVIQVQHSWTVQGYENHFIATPAQRWSPAQRPPRPMLDGIYPARVVDNHDSHNQGRIRIQYYWQEDGQSTWVRLLTPHAGAGRGTLFLPELGDEVLVTFEDGDAERPHVVGSAWNGVHQPPTTGFHQPGETNGSEFAANNIKRIVTKSGHRITLIDTPGKETISISTPTSSRLMLTESHADTGGRPAIVLETLGDIVMAAPNGRIHHQSMYHSADVGEVGAAAVAKSPAASSPENALGGKGAKPAAGPCAGQGMDTPARKQAFAAQMKDLQKQWKGLRPDERLEHLSKIVNDSGSQSGIPPVAMTAGDISPAAGSFSASSWSMKIDKSLLSSKTLSNDQTAQLGGTLYHEGRHSEQSYLIARNVASEKLPDDQVSKQSPVPKSVNDAAGKQPLDKDDPQWKCSQVMRETKVGAGAKHRAEATEQASADRVELNQKNDAFVAAANDPHGSLDKVKAAKNALDKAQTKADASYKAYRELPNEADAFATGDSVQDMLHH